MTGRRIPLFTQAVYSRGPTQLPGRREFNPPWANVLNPITGYLILGPTQPNLTILGQTYSMYPWLRVKGCAMSFMTLLKSEKMSEKNQVLKNLPFAR